MKSSRRTIIGEIAKRIEAHFKIKIRRRAVRGRGVRQRMLRTDLLITCHLLRTSKMSVESVQIQVTLSPYSVAARQATSCCRASCVISIRTTSSHKATTIAFSSPAPSTRNRIVRGVNRRIGRRRQV